MNKLDERGLVPFPGYDKIGYGKHTSWITATTAQRDAMRDLFESWIEEEFPSYTENDGTISKNQFAIKFQRRIAKFSGASK